MNDAKPASPSIASTQLVVSAGAAPPAVLSDAVILDRLLRELPHWTFEKGELQRRFGTHDWKSSLMVANTVGHLAEAAWHHPDLVVTYSAVIVKLSTHASQGVTERDFALAHKIEEVVQWQPGQTPGSALAGTPQDRAGMFHVKFD